MSASEYEPEPWNVVRDDGVIVVRSVGITAADNSCLWLNRQSGRRGRSYEVRSAELCGIYGCTLAAHDRFTAHSWSLATREESACSV